MGRMIALLVALAVGVMIARFEERLPAPRLASAPQTAFSAERAMVDVAAMARAPHPIGSAENLRVRDHLIDRMAQLGLTPQIHAGIGVQQPRQAPDVIVGAPVQNLIGVLPGRDPAAPALALMAHYDSVAASPGAADDAAGVASALEIVRAIKAQGTPARDVIVLITDGEEAGLLGANAFFQRDPLAKRVGLVINMEARGAGGRVLMFQTSPQNGQLIRLIQHHGVRPSSSSMTVFVYEKMPNDTDLTESLKVGVDGMNYAFIGRQFDYHSSTSTPAWLDQGSLQDMGQEVLASASAAAFAPTLPRHAASAVYANTFESWILAYPAWVGWLVLAGAGALIAFGVNRARRAEAFPRTDLLRGAAGLMFAVLGAVAVMQFARHATGAGFGFLEQRFLLAQVSRWELAIMLVGAGFVILAIAEMSRGRRIAAVIPLLAGAACSAFGGFDPVGLGVGAAAAVFGLLALGRPVSRSGAWGGALLAGLVLAVIAQALAPPAANILAWPLALAALAAALTSAAHRRDALGLIVLGVSAALGVGWIGSLAHASFQSLDLMALLGLPALLAALVVWPLAQPADGAPPARWIGPILLLAGLAMTAAVRFGDPYDARHPQATYVMYQVDQSANRAWRISLTPDLPKWSRQVLTADGGAITKLKEWVWGEPIDAAAAPMVTLAEPQITLTRQADGGLTLHAAPPIGSDNISLRLTSTVAMKLQTVADVVAPLDLKPGKTARVIWQASPQGVDLVLTPSGPGRLEVRYTSVRPDWPAAARPLPSRSASVAPFNESDGTLVAGIRSLSW